MSTVRWARLVGAADCGLRRGAWYPVTAVSATEVQVHVRGRLTRVARSLLELRDAPPGEWTIVRGPFSLLRVPAGAREGYVVCPNCRAREPIPETAATIARCARCNQAFAVAWDRSSSAARSPSPSPSAAVDTLRRDRRMTRRRRGTDRRAGPERRAATRRTAVLIVLVERRMAERRAMGERRVVARRSLAVDRRKRATVW